jgi:enoyl-CoA hydratase
LPSKKGGCEVEYEFILTETRDRVGLIRINRPKQLNALNAETMAELTHACGAFDADPDVGCIVITGNEQAFGAGADIKEMMTAELVNMLGNPFIEYWDRLRQISKPIIAAVSGYCLGGGNELAMACDLIVASETAVFGQPEINLGVIPGAGGTQRLTRAVGKSIAMEVMLNDRRLTAQEAHQWGLVNRVVPVERYLDEAIHLANEIAARAPVAVRMAKEAVDYAFESSLGSGLAFERRLFYLLFGTKDQKEGMKAFVEKRKAEWSGN